MAVWEQNTHDPVWNSDKSDLVNGGGQWTGHIPLPIYKNIAAQLTIGYENVDVRVSAFSEELLNKMPASVYPFEVNIALAKKARYYLLKTAPPAINPIMARFTAILAPIWGVPRLPDYLSPLVQSAALTMCVARIL